jgi:hypothetical protein
MNSDYPSKAATVEEGATVVPRPNLPGYSSFLYTGMEGALANADSAATSEVVALYQNPGSGLCEQSVLQRWDGGPVRKGR